MRLSLREDSMIEIVNLEKNLFENLNSTIINFLDKINILKERTQYRPIGELSNALNHFIHEVVKNSILLSYEEWKNSDDSFAKIASKFRVGDLAEEEARKYERNIETIIKDSCLAIPEADLNGLSNININSEDLDEIKLYCNNLYTELEELEVNFKSQIDDLREQNVIANGLLPLAEFQLSSFKALAEIVNNISDSLIEHFVILLEENKKRLERAAEESLRRAREIGSSKADKGKTVDSSKTISSSDGSMGSLNSSDTAWKSSLHERDDDQKIEDSTYNEAIDKESVGKMVEGLKELEGILSEADVIESESDNKDSIKKQNFLAKIKKWIDNNPEAVKFINAAGKAALKMAGIAIVAKTGGLSSILGNLTKFLLNLDLDRDNGFIKVVRFILGGLDFDKLIKTAEGDEQVEEQGESQDKKTKLDEVVEELVKDFGKELIKNITEDMFDSSHEVFSGVASASGNSDDVFAYGNDARDKGLNNSGNNGIGNISNNISNNIDMPNNNVHNGVNNSNLKPIHPMYRNSKLYPNDFVDGLPNKYIPEVDEYKPAFESKELDDATSKFFSKGDIDRIHATTFSQGDMEYLKTEIQDIKSLLKAQKEGSVLPPNSDFLKLLNRSADYANNTMNDIEGNEPRAAVKDFSKPLTKEDVNFLRNVIDDMNLDDMTNNSLNDALKHMTKNIVRREYGYPYERNNKQAVISNPGELASAVKGNQDLILVPSELMEQVHSVMKLKETSSFAINALIALLVIMLPLGIALTPFTGGLVMPATASVIAATVLPFIKLSKEDILNIVAMVATSGLTVVTLLFKGYSIVKDSMEGLLLKKNEG